MKEVYEVGEVIVMLLGWVFAGAMLLRSFTLLAEAPVFYGVLRREYSTVGAGWVTFRYLVLPSLLAAPGWIVVSGWHCLCETTPAELEEMALEVLEMLEEE